MAISIPEEKALFRFNIIFPITNPNLAPGIRASMIREICAKEYKIPHSKKTHISENTVYGWYRTYMEAGTIDSLAPKGRSDKGKNRKLTPEAREELLNRYRAKEDYVPTNVMVENAQRDGVFTSADTVGMGRLYQIFRDNENNSRNPHEKDRRAFRAPEINDQWQSDAMHGRPCLLNDGTEIVPKMFACIDNRSRLICYSAWYRSETADCYMDCLWNAFQIRGLPRTCFYDNGSSFRDERLKLGCASLGVQLIYAKPYSPASKGCIERFNRTVRQQFLSRLSPEPITLDELNERYRKWVDDYNRRPHSSLDGKSPLQCYLSEVKAIRQAPENLPLYFRAKEERIVRHDRTVSYDNVRYQVPLGYSGKKIELRFFESDPENTMEGFFNGKSIGMLKKLDREANYTIRRKK